MIERASGELPAGRCCGAAVVCFLLPGVLAAGLLPPTALDSVVAIGAKDVAGDTRWLGSGFIYADNPVKKLADGMTANALFLVTNKHVLSGVGTAVIRFNSPGTQPTQEYVVSLRNQDGSLKWFGHKDPNVDIAILPFDLPDEVRKRITGINPIFRQFQAADRAKLRDLGVTEGDRLFVLGFPVSLFADTALANDLFPGGQNIVFVREGIIARIRDTLSGLTNRFLIDAFVFPGNSGGPVILQPENVAVQGTKLQTTPYLIGVIAAYLPYQDLAFSRQTNRARFLSEENSGLSVVIPMDFVNETIDEYNKIERPSK